MPIKSYYLVALALLLSEVCFGQQVKNYFFPSPGKNMMIFGRPDTKDKTRNNLETHVYFKDMGDTAVITTTYFDGTVFKESWEQLVSVHDAKIAVVKERSINTKTITRFKRDEFILFEMPSDNSKVEWTHPGQKGREAQIFEAENVNLMIDGQRKKAVKVTTYLKKKRSGEKTVYCIDFYVEGTGRYKRISEAGAPIEILKDQKFDPNPPPVK